MGGVGSFTGVVSIEWTFLDSRIQSQYEQEQRLGQVFTTCASLAVLITCIGLFGLSAFMTAQRSKEIGVRKVVGASVRSIVVLLSGEFSRLVIAANLIAWPLAWYTMDQWLGGFAYRIEFGVGTFAISGCVAMGVAWTTVAWQTLRAAQSDPVDALRSE